MTRAEIAAHYVIVNGFIHSPGKFQGEPVYAPHFYALVGLGEGVAQDDDHSIWFPIREEVRKEFPELDAEASQVEVYITDDFVCCTQLDEKGQPL